MDNSLSHRDLKNIWHPYTQMKGMELPVPIKRAKGSLLITEDGREIIDAVASWWVNPHGHGHPHIAERVKEQILELDHIIFAGFTHEPAVLLSEKMLEITPSGHSKLFFADNGSTAVEVALKMALQYFQNKGEQRLKFVAFEDAFHGDTFGAMSVSGEGVFTHSFADLLIDVVRIPIPVKGREMESLQLLESALKQGEVAAFIFEPLLLGAAGMITYEPEILDKLIELCKKYDVLTIADEVMTGFGRTGKMFACEHLSVQPDMACYSKCLTGGVLPMSITTCTEEVYQAFYSDDKWKTLMHGHSFTANAVGCAAALASLEIFEFEHTIEKIKHIESRHKAFKQKIKDNSNIREIRHIGVVLAMELESGEETSYLNPIRDKLYNFFLKRDILLRPLGNVIYILPPYSITDQELEKVYNAIEELLRSL